MIGGQRIQGKHDLYRVQKVVEKPTPTQAEQDLAISGMRSGHYLCFFGMHVLTPGIMEILDKQFARIPGNVTLSDALSELAGREQYLALEQASRRYDVGVKYGLFCAQLALALDGRDRKCSTRATSGTGPLCIPRMPERLDRALERSGRHHHVSGSGRARSLNR